MMRVKRCFKVLSVLFLAAVVAVGSFTPVLAKTAGMKADSAVIKGKSGKTAKDIVPKKVTAVKKKVTVTAGSKFELKVKTVPANAEDDYLVWSIKKDKGVISFEDDDRTGDDVSFIANKAGQAKVIVNIGETSKKAVFTVVVNGKGKNTGKDGSSNNPGKDTSKGKITADGSTDREVNAEDCFDLSVKTSGGVDASSLKWTIEDTQYVTFDEHNGEGKSADFYAVKEGTTTITCTNASTNEQVVYTVEVLPYVEEDDDEDVDDEDLDDEDIDDEDLDDEI